MTRVFSLALGATKQEPLLKNCLDAARASL
jgi:hypothetical protein